MNQLTTAVAAVITDPAGRVLVCQQRQGHRLWALPGGKIHPGESPLHAAVRDICEEVGAEVTLVDLVGLYQLTSHGDDLPDVLVHVFRAKIDGEVTVNSPGRISRVCWHDVDDCPSPMTPVTRAAIADAAVGKAGLLRVVQRDAEPDIPDAIGDDQDVSDAIYAAAN
ncbi:MAG TPA: NUDIX hydrolase [Micromonosporaceae bacterium]|jgi:8-oxo-dGTP pyrophosphatase MutT (NUDIX family)|nr:NUDIX hydrolase [Micromonosporaceae bacterium]HKE65111.1 NUDIX hydrolase [Micromonosporaceae bacterium]